LERAVGDHHALFGMEKRWRRRQSGRSMRGAARLPLPVSGALDRGIGADADRDERLSRRKSGTSSCAFHVSGRCATGEDWPLRAPVRPGLPVATGRLRGCRGEADLGLAAAASRSKRQAFRPTPALGRSAVHRPTGGQPELPSEHSPTRSSRHSCAGVVKGRRGFHNSRSVPAADGERAAAGRAAFPCGSNASTVRRRPPPSAPSRSPAGWFARQQQGGAPPAHGQGTPPPRLINAAPTRFASSRQPARRCPPIDVRASSASVLRIAAAAGSRGQYIRRCPCQPHAARIELAVNVPLAAACRFKRSFRESAANRRAAQAARGKLRHRSANWAGRAGAARLVSRRPAPD